MDTQNEYGTLAIQCELLPILKAFHNFCVENDISYSLAYGSLLGAIRHNGFIPWDDDVDVIVTRDNFTKICQSIGNCHHLQWDYLTKSSLWLGRVKSANQLTETEYPPIVDVFILDNVPDNRFIAKLKLLLIRLLQGTIKKKPDLSRFRFFMKVCAYLSWLLGKLIPAKIKYSLYESVSKWGNKRNTKKISCYNTIFGYLGRDFSAAMISSYALCPFEDTELYVMNGYDEFLRINYGDYMTPPSEKVGHHLHPEYSHSYK